MKETGWYLAFGQKRKGHPILQQGLHGEVGDIEDSGMGLKAVGGGIEDHKVWIFSPARVGELLLDEGGRLT